MAAKQSSSSRPEFHSCPWCQRVLLDFSANATLTMSADQADAQSITVPMLFEGFAANCRERSEFIRCMNEFLSVSADDGCFFSQTVMKELRAFHEYQPVKTVFSWIGGIEFVSERSSVCLLNYYWWKPTERIFLDPNTYRIPSNTLRHVKEWLSECETSHPECQRRYETQFIPTRLLQIDRVGAKCSVRLTYPRESSTYTALSYCWGGAQDTVYTTSNQRLWETSGPPWEKLPRTIQDAILVTSVLGIEFIWIDSLCILQDDDSDMDIQITQMPQIYNNAMVTISAVGMSSVHDRLFKPMRQPLLHAKSILKLPVLGAPNSCECAILVPSHEVQVTSLEGDHVAEPLEQRAWTFQETLLSRRLLKFTSSTMRWECQRHLERDFDEGKRARILDSFPLHNAIRRMRHHANLNYILRSGQLHCPNGRESDRPETGFDQPDMYPWHMIVEEYSRRSLSFPQDRALAISGIAERIGNKTKDQYCAGLWRSCLVNQLAWYDSSAERSHNLEEVMSFIPNVVLNSVGIITAESHSGPVVHQSGGAFSLPIGNECEQRRSKKLVVGRAGKNAKELSAPSWSWISIPKPVLFRVSDISFTLEIVDVQIEHSLEAARFGNVKFGQLTVRGPVKPSTVSSGADVEFLTDGPPGSISDNSLLMKLGEDKSVESGSNQSAICLELQRKTEHTWVRVRLSETSNNDWLGIRTIIII